MITERTVYAGILIAATFWALKSAIFLLASSDEDDRGRAWFWGASLASAWCFWQLLGESA